MPTYEDLLRAAKQMISDFPSDWADFCRRANILQPDEDDILDFHMWVTR